MRRIGRQNSRPRAAAIFRDRCSVSSSIDLLNPPPTLPCPSPPPSPAPFRHPAPHTAVPSRLLLLFSHRVGAPTPVLPLPRTSTSPSTSSTTSPPRTPFHQSLSPPNFAASLSHPSLPRPPSPPALPHSPFPPQPLSHLQVPPSHRFRTHPVPSPPRRRRPNLRPSHELCPLLRCPSPHLLIPPSPLLPFS
eukprot:2710895-Pleurochrysis_carterae.AAC.1